MSGVDHDGLAELAADGSRRRLGGVCWSENFAGFAHGISTLINEGYAFFCAWRVAEFLRAVAGFASGHELDNLFPVFATINGAEDLP